MAQRVKNLEDTDVLKLIHDIESAEGDVQTDIVVIAEDE
jgi:hypothetical protein